MAYDPTKDLAHLRELKAQATKNGTQRPETIPCDQSDYERWVAFARFIRPKLAEYYACNRQPCR